MRRNKTLWDLGLSVNEYNQKARLLSTIMEIIFRRKEHFSSIFFLSIENIPQFNFMQRSGENCLSKRYNVFFVYWTINYSKLNTNLPGKYIKLLSPWRWETRGNVYSTYTTDRKLNWFSAVILSTSESYLSDKNSLAANVLATIHIIPEVTILII